MTNLRKLEIKISDLFHGNECISWRCEEIGGGKRKVKIFFPESFYFSYATREGIETQEELLDILAKVFLENEFSQHKINNEITSS